MRHNNAGMGISTIQLQPHAFSFAKAMIGILPAWILLIGLQK
jgi:hypothetical protein